MENPDIPRVGAPDPDLKTSPILDELAEEGLDPTFEEAMCYYNDVAYDIGEYVRSGEELLQCVERGVWVRSAEIEP